MLQEVVSAASMCRKGGGASEILQIFRFMLTMFLWEVSLREVVSAASVHQNRDVSIEIPKSSWFVLTISQWWVKLYEVVSATWFYSKGDRACEIPDISLTHTDDVSMVSQVTEGGTSNFIILKMVYHQ
jgi:hypothetical protein